MSTQPKVSAILQFRLWHIYRSWLLPFLIVTSLISMIFSGVQTAEKFEHVNVVLGLLVASLLMFLHGTYLILMAYQLVYRHPVYPAQWLGLAYVPIFIGYLSHTLHANHAHEGVILAVLSAPATSTGAFAGTYLSLVLAHLCHSHRPGHKTDRPALQARTRWMFWTDVTALALTSYMTVKSLFFAAHHVVIKEWLVAQIRSLAVDFPEDIRIFLSKVYQQTSEKDVVIFGSLLAYLLIRVILVFRGRRTLAGLYHDTKVAQTLVSSPTEWAPFCGLLPGHEPQWLDLGSGSGEDFKQLVDELCFPAGSKGDSRYPKHVHYLDQDAAALAAIKGSAFTIHACTMKSAAAEGLIPTCKVVHLAHVAYTAEVAQQAVDLLTHAEPGTLLIVRFTSDASYYRAVSASMSCVPFIPYTYNAVHRLLLDDLQAQNWVTVGQPCILKSDARIDMEGVRQNLVKWSDAAYGEFSGDVVERFIEGFHRSRETRFPNYDWVVALRKHDPDITVRPLQDGDVEEIYQWPLYQGEQLSQLSYALRKGGWLDDYPMGADTRRFAISKLGKLVGYSLLTHINASSAEFYIALHPEAHGVGRQTTRMILAEGAKLNLKSVHLKVRDWHQVAQITYAHCGFQKKESFSEPIQGKPVDFIRMEYVYPAPGY